MLEVERKAWLRDPDTFRERLEAEASLVATSVKEDRYYLLGREPGATVDLARDPIFRVRTSGGRAVLGWKSRTFQGFTEVNEEREIDMGDPGPVIDWLEGYLGLEPFVTKVKHTRLYALPGALAPARVELNRIEGLGHFVEVEVLEAGGDPEEAVALLDRVFERLAIPASDVETRYYIDLLMTP
jgi:predicted adenylyl cyclase CyaB